MFSVFGEYLQLGTAGCWFVRQVVDEGESVSISFWRHTKSVSKNMIMHLPVVGGKKKGRNKQTTQEETTNNEETR